MFLPSVGPRSRTDGVTSIYLKNDIPLTGMTIYLHEYFLLAANLHLEFLDDHSKCLLETTQQLTINFSQLTILSLSRS